MRTKETFTLCLVLAPFVGLMIGTGWAAWEDYQFWNNRPPGEVPGVPGLKIEDTCVAESMRQLRAQSRWYQEAVPPAVTPYTTLAPKCSVRTEVIREDGTTSVNYLMHQEPHRD